MFLPLFARLWFVLIVVQFHAAGLANFGAASFTVHAVTGRVFILPSLALTIAALVSKARRQVAWIAAVILVLSALQPAIALGLRQFPWVRALHPVVGLMIGGLLILFAKRGTPAARQS